MFGPLLKKPKIYNYTYVILRPDLPEPIRWLGSVRFSTIGACLDTALETSSAKNGVLLEVRVAEPKEINPW